jgi:hypothetical protein
MKVVGQAIVLYLRLNLVTREMAKFRWTIYVILGNCLCFLVPTAVLLAMVSRACSQVTSLGDERLPLAKMSYAVARNRPTGIPASFRLSTCCRISRSRLSLSKS